MHARRRLNELCTLTTHPVESPNTMPTYRIDLELRSGLGTPLAADTLWGHLCWGLRHHHGQQVLNEWLERHDTAEPPLVLSDPFPAGYWPRPVLPPAPRPIQPPRKEHADERKRLDKISWLTDAALRECLNAVSPDAIHHAAQTSSKPPVSHELAVTHAGVNRLTGGTAQEGGGVLFTTTQNYFASDARFSVWARSPESIDTVRQWFEQGLIGGYGRDASSGLGQIIVTDVVTAELPTAKQPNAVLLLGPTVPKPGDPHRGFFQLGTRSGRVGGDFAIGPLPDGSTQRQKRPVHCLLAGSVLLTDHPPAFVGRVLRNVHQWSELRHYGLGLTLPIRLE